MQIADSKEELIPMFGFSSNQGEPTASEVTEMLDIGVGYAQT